MSHGRHAFTAAGGAAGKQLKRYPQPHCQTASVTPLLEQVNKLRRRDLLILRPLQPEVSSAALTDRRKATTVSGLPRR